jgi:hypothetical protein
MNWLAWVGIAVVVTAAAAVTGAQPTGARPAARTRLMGTGRLALLAFVIICGYLAFRGHAGG